MRHAVWLERRYDTHWNNPTWFANLSLPVSNICQLINTSFFSLDACVSDRSTMVLMRNPCLLFWELDIFSCSVILTDSEQDHNKDNTTTKEGLFVLYAVFKVKLFLQLLCMSGSPSRLSDLTPKKNLQESETVILVDMICYSKRYRLKREGSWGEVQKKQVKSFQAALLSGVAQDAPYSPRNLGDDGWTVLPTGGTHRSLESKVFTGGRSCGHTHLCNWLQLLRPSLQCKSRCSLAVMLLRNYLVKPEQCDPRPQAYKHSNKAEHSKSSELSCLELAKG